MSNAAVTAAPRTRTRRHRAEPARLDRPGLRTGVPGAGRRRPADRGRPAGAYRRTAGGALGRALVRHRQPRPGPLRPDRRRRAALPARGHQQRAGGAALRRAARTAGRLLRRPVDRRRDHAHAGGAAGAAGVHPGALHPRHDRHGRVAVGPGHRRPRQPRSSCCSRSPSCPTSPGSAAPRPWSRSRRSTSTACGWWACPAAHRRGGAAAQRAATGAGAGLPLGRHRHLLRERPVLPRSRHPATGTEPRATSSRARRAT